MTSFDAIWSGLIKDLHQGVEIHGWSKDKGETSTRFKIVETGSTWISVLPSTGNPRRISRGDFDQVYAFWPDYKNGKVGRAEMARISQNTSYIFAILHWAEN